ncbi:hypothetical protein [Nocardiopsis ganjiahuensis]|uniref:hypothetical protein n=1 Tax=Nocardiopsis ganjiahuensis TaxID=239984 RepID=UPI000592D0B0|nr:hypothetical protein [Nocardiopsis ganjiahuensis]
MSYPDPPQQPRWQQPQQPGQGFPQQPGPGQPHFAPPQQPGPQQPGGQYPGGQYPGGQYTGPQQPGQQYPGAGGQPPQGPGAPMGPGGPGDPGQPPYGGQYSGGQVPPSGGGRKWLIPAAAGVALVLMGGTLWAAVSLVDFSGPQPESVLPGNSVAFGKVDLDVDGSQVLDLMQFVEKLPDEITEETGELDEDTSGPFAEVFAETYELDQSEVEAWIGQKAGIASWPATDPEAEFDEGMALAVALAVEDPAAAEAQFETLRDTDDVYFEMVDDFVVFTESEAEINEYNDQMSAHGDLASNDVYSGDLGNVPSGSIALAWADLGELSRMSGFEEELGSEFGATGADSVEGRMTASVRVDGDYLEARTDVFGFEVENEDLTWLADAPGASLEAVGGLPADTVMAFGGSGLDEALRTAWEEDNIPMLNDSDRSEMESFFNSVGAPLPDGFTSLLGTSTAFGLTSFDPDDYNWEPSFEYRAVDGDESAINGFLDESFNDPYSSGPAPSVSSDGDTVVVSHGQGGSGRLGEDEVFQQTMQEMDDAVLAGYFDLRQALSRNDVDSPEQWGAVGLGLSVAEGGQRVVVELRWAPSGG